MTDRQLEDRLTAQGFVIYERWHTSEVLGFVRRELSRPAWPLTVLFVILLVIVAASAYALIRAVQQEPNWFSDAVGPFLIGMVGVVPLVPPHELLHGLAYKLLGAPKVVYGADWKQLVFHASAPGHPLGKWPMTVVALSPFVVITPLLLTVMVVSKESVALMFLGALLMHTQGCLGDFAMVNYFFRQPPDSDVLTYDEQSASSFVFVKRIVT